MDLLPPPSHGFSNLCRRLPANTVNEIGHLFNAPSCGPSLLIGNHPALHDKSRHEFERYGGLPPQEFTVRSGAIGKIPGRPLINDSAVFHHDDAVEIAQR